MSAKQRAEKLAAERGMTITQDREGLGITVRIEAPHGQNFGGDHEIVIHYYSGSPWAEVITAISQSSPAPCDAETCGGWVDGVCEWWSTEVQQ